MLFSSFPLLLVKSTLCLFSSAALPCSSVLSWSWDPIFSISVCVFCYQQNFLFVFLCLFLLKYTVRLLSLLLFFFISWIIILCKASLISASGFFCQSKQFWGFYFLYLIFSVLCYPQIVCFVCLSFSIFILLHIDVDLSQSGKTTLASCTFFCKWTSWIFKFLFYLFYLLLSQQSILFISFALKSYFSSLWLHFPQRRLFVSLSLLLFPLIQFVLDLGQRFLNLCFWRLL